MNTKYVLKIMFFTLLIASFGFLVSFDSSENLNIKYKKETPKPVISKIQIALLLDTSGSMSGLINQAKDQLWEMVTEISNEMPDAKIELALYEYGNDDLSVRQHYVKKVTGFTTNLDNVSSELYKLRTNGGEEYCGAVIKNANENLEWSDGKGVKRVIFIAGNEPFTQGNISYKESLSASKKSDIQVNTIFCGNRVEGIKTNWQDGARLGNGEFFVINHNDRAWIMPTPYDGEIIKCNTQLNSTYVPIYEDSKSEKLELVANDMQQSTERLVQKTLLKKNKNVYSKSWDGVEMIQNDASFKIDTEQVLNTEFEGLSEKEIKEYLEKKSKERKALHKKLAELEKKRKKYLEENQVEKNENTLGKQMVKAIKN